MSDGTVSTTHSKGKGQILPIIPHHYRHYFAVQARFQVYVVGRWFCNASSYYICTDKNNRVMYIGKDILRVH